MEGEREREGGKEAGRGSVGTGGERQTNSKAANIGQLRASPSAAPAEARPSTPPRMT